MKIAILSFFLSVLFLNPIFMKPTKDEIMSTENRMTGIKDFVYFTAMLTADGHVGTLPLFMGHQLNIRRVL